MIKLDGVAAQMGGELKRVSAELDYLKMLNASTSRAAVRSAPQESVERRVKRMLERLEEGGEAAQHAVRSLFPRGIWL